MMLAPLVITLGFIASSRAKESNADSARAPIPWFVFGFIALVGINSIISIPSGITAIVAQVTSMLLSVALAAMGLETDFEKLRKKARLRTTSSRPRVFHFNR